ncbi:hypothetical protein [Acaryochloris marina]|uniref:hypothetical protein n=1 Tax=Acaryochloris marina TaxID=155978 RepID=UPI0011D09BAD|nr:hypothetical protein [Acaryochloris marina]BDM83230.1 hypothetical protein AM10699_60910 [Acaryochloris marina MBIC10699]
MVVPRVLNDFYPTPATVTEKLHNSVFISGNVFEPCVGNNAVTDVLNQCLGITAIESDLR